MKTPIHIRLDDELLAWAKATALASKPKSSLTAVVEQALRRERAAATRDGLIASEIASINAGRTLEAGPGGSSSAEQAEARATRSPVQPRTPTTTGLVSSAAELAEAREAKRLALERARERGRR